MSELSEAIELLRFETDFEASQYAGEDHDDPEHLESINARIVVLKAISACQDSEGNLPVFVPDEHGGRIEFNGKRWRPII